MKFEGRFTSKVQDSQNFKLTNLHRCCANSIENVGYYATTLPPGLCAKPNLYQKDNAVTLGEGARQVKP